MKTKQKAVILLCTLSMLLSACASTSVNDRKKPDSNLSVLDNIQNSLDESAQYCPSLNKSRRVGGVPVKL